MKLEILKIQLNKEYKPVISKNQNLNKINKKQEFYKEKHKVNKY